MIFYESETTTGLILTSIPALISIYFFYVKGNIKIALIFLLISAFLLRLLMISLDPFLYEWDERFHALVAKNMIENPFKPMLFTHPILKFNPLDWGSLHVWIHKQPVFLWQMAASMKIFGINVFALRLPSAIMGCLMVLMTYDMSRKWIESQHVAFISAFLSTFAFYSLELISGRMSLDHNDLTFTFYMTCCFWAFTSYVNSSYKFKWVLLIGIFSGLAILNKWLVGLLIFGGWGLYLILRFKDLNFNRIRDIGLAVIISCFVFIPWQLYTKYKFPIQSAIAHEYNLTHMTEDLGHPGNSLFHIMFLETAYHKILLVFLVIGILLIFLTKKATKSLSISFVAMIAVLFIFFSIMVATKMPAFVYPVSSLILILISFGVYQAYSWFMVHENFIEEDKKIILIATTIMMGFFSLKPWVIVEHRSKDDAFRNNKIHNTSIFKHMDKDIAHTYVLLNTRAYENIELMFFQDCTSYPWYPKEQEIDSLQNLGYKFAAFNYLNDPQQLPDYILQDSNILKMDYLLK